MKYLHFFGVMDDSQGKLTLIIYQIEHFATIY
jgi:hypothetical protein